MYIATVLILCVALVSGAHVSQKQIFEIQYQQAKLGADITISVIDMIIDAGYPVETHSATTEDGYILTLHRIPYGRKSPAAPNKPVAFVMHGLLCSSADWVVTGPEKGLAFMLADAGYDVWMGNARGNTLSRKHVTLNPDKGDFWQFSWHHIGKYDLPAMIDYTLKVTGASAVHYAGHSQGTTSFFIMTSLRPEYNAKIRSMHALAPIAYMSNLYSPFVQFVANFVDAADFLSGLFGINEFLPNNELMSMFGGAACKDEAMTQDICTNFLFLVGGFNSQQMNATQLPYILANTPAGASVKQFFHYGQGVNSAKFREYDYGWIKNLVEYGSLSPPDYPLEKITAPVALHYSDNDWMSHPKDVDKLAARLSNLIGKFKVPDPKFNHLDYMWAMDVDTLLNNKVISIMNRY